MPDITLDEWFANRTKLQLVSILYSAESWEYGAIIDILQISQSQLSKYIAFLRENDIVTVTKGSKYLLGKKRSTTWVALTKSGRAWYESFIQQLKELIEQAENTENIPAN